MFESVFSLSDSLSITTVLLCFLFSIILGFIIAFTHMKTGKYTKNFVITLTILPSLIECVMIMVNGSLGTSVAVLGAFSLVRFRSIPGNSREITSIFLAMATGLVLGMGHILFAILITILTCLIMFILYLSKFGEKKNISKILKITIPENLDYTNVFEDIFTNYTKYIKLEQAKTTNMGSMYELKYNVELKDNVNEKEFIDTIRCRNGNLSISLTNLTLDMEL